MQQTQQEIQGMYYQSDVAVTGRTSPLSFAQRCSVSMARHSKKLICFSLFSSIAISTVALKWGKLRVDVDLSGWWSRKSKIANRSTQQLLIRNHNDQLFNDFSGKFWDDLMYTMQKDWRTVKTTRRLRDKDDRKRTVCNGSWYGSEYMINPGEMNLITIWKTIDADDENADSSALDSTALYEMCVAEERTLDFLEKKNLCYKCTDSSKCILPYSLVSVAKLYLMGRKAINNPFLVPSMSCDSLRNKWKPNIQTDFTNMLLDCARNVLEEAKVKPATSSQTRKCHLPYFIPTIVDFRFPETEVIKYTSSMYANKDDEMSIATMYEASKSNLFETSPGSTVMGLYEVGINSLYATWKQSFYELYMKQTLPKDLGLAGASAILTTLIMLLHTKSPFVTTIAFIQIVLAFPVAYFVYYYMCGIAFFPSVNYNGVFVVFALGVDDVFISFDIWKNNRRHHPNTPTDSIAALALPNASYAAFVTSITTSVAFLGTAVTNIPAVQCFGLFTGVLVAVDYVLNIMIVFPCLCIHDQWHHAVTKNITTAFDQGHDIDDANETKSCSTEDNQEANQICTEASTSAVTCGETATLGNFGNYDGVLIHRILGSYFRALHKIRWVIFLLSLGAIAACSYLTTQLRPSDTPNPSFLPSTNPYELHRKWSNQLLSVRLSRGQNGRMSFIWGVIPADTGSSLDPGSLIIAVFTGMTITYALKISLPYNVFFLPDEWTTLALDNMFDPRSVASQLHLLGLCGSLFEYGFTNKLSDQTSDPCPMKEFDKWLMDQSVAAKQDKGFIENCKNSSFVPVLPDLFDRCIIHWTRQSKNTNVLSYKGRVKIMMIQTESNTTYEDPFTDQSDEWHRLESWLEIEERTAPEGVNNPFFASVDFWFYDTLSNMISSAYKSAGIAMAVASAIILTTSSSLVLTAISAISILYVLVGSTACLVRFGWVLGMFECILFAILIGVGCDSVLHFAHAYSASRGNISRSERARFAIIQIGPSVLASGVTTLVTAAIMMLAEMVYFRKFAIMLATTITHSIIASFVVFLSLSDCFGPSEPTKIARDARQRLCKELCCCTQRTSDNNHNDVQG